MGQVQSYDTPGDAPDSPRCREFCNEVIDEMTRTIIAEKINMEQLENEAAPTILLLGPTGVGKSSLINTVFGFDTAETRASGKPCTEKFYVYGPFESKPICIVDSRGIETGVTEMQRKLILDYIARCNRHRRVEAHVHIVWYLPDKKWEEDDHKTISVLQAHGLPVIVVINKCDSDERREKSNGGQRAYEALRDTVLEDFPDVPVLCCGNPRLNPSIDYAAPECCPRGHQRSNFIINKRRRKWACDHEADGMVCDERGELVRPAQFGYHELVEVTSRVLPDMIRHAFMRAQRVVLEERRAEAGRLISQSYWRGISSRGVEDLMGLETQLASKLLSVYNVPNSMITPDLFQELTSMFVDSGTGSLSRENIEAWKLSSIGYPVGTRLDAYLCGKILEAVGMGIVIAAERLLFYEESGGQETSATVFKREVTTVCYAQDINNMALQRREFQSMTGLVNDSIDQRVSQLAKEVERKIVDSLEERTTRSATPSNTTNVTRIQS